MRLNTTWSESGVAAGGWDGPLACGGDHSVSVSVIRTSQSIRSIPSNLSLRRARDGLYRCLLVGKLFLLRELCPGMSSLQLRWGDSGLDKLACQVWRLRDVYWNINGSKQRWIEMD